MVCSTSDLGQKRPESSIRRESALSSTAALTGATRHTHFVPTADIAPPAHSKIKRPPTEAASKLAKKHLGYCDIASTMNERACVVLPRIALTSFMYAELLKACAFSTLSNA